MTTSLIRAMANTLLDHDANLLSDRDIVLVLNRAGFTAKDMRDNLDQAVAMALARRANELRNRRKRG